MTAFLAHAAYRVAELSRAKDRAQDWEFEDGPLSNSFVSTNRRTGEVFINYKGQYFEERRLLIRVRIHNWLVRFGSRIHPTGKAQD